MKWIKVFDNFNTNAIEDYFIGLEDDNFCQSIEVSSLRDILEKGMTFDAGWHNPPHRIGHTVNFSESDINILRSAYEILFKVQFWQLDSPGQRQSILSSRSGSISAPKNGVLVEEILKMSEKIWRVKIFFDKNTFNKNTKSNINYQEEVIEKYIERLRSVEPEYTFLPSTLYDGSKKNGYFWGPFYGYVIFYLLKG
jgi:hypothetical protein